MSYLGLVPEFQYRVCVRVFVLGYVMSLYYLLTTKCPCSLAKFRELS
jgi:hypothetical protein